MPTAPTGGRERRQKEALRRLAAMVEQERSAERSRRLEQRWTLHDQLVRGNPVRTVRVPLA